VVRTRSAKGEPRVGTSLRGEFSKRRADIGPWRDRHAQLIFFFPSYFFFLPPPPPPPGDGVSGSRRGYAATDSRTRTRDARCPVRPDDQEVSNGCEKPSESRGLSCDEFAAPPRARSSYAHATCHRDRHRTRPAENPVDVADRTSANTSSGRSITSPEHQQTRSRRNRATSARRGMGECVTDARRWLLPETARTVEVRPGDVY